MSELCKSWWGSSGSAKGHVDEELTFTYTKGDIRFIKIKNSFDLTGSKVNALGGVRSWILNSAVKGLEEIDSKWNISIVEIGGSFPLLDIIGELLQHGLATAKCTIDNHRKRRVSSRFGADITLEAALWFTLYTLERRIESYWSQMIVTTPDEQAIKELKTKEKIAAVLASDKERLVDLIDGTLELEIEPAIASFLGLWIEVSHQIDPFSNAEEFRVGFLSVLDAWSNDDRLYIDAPSDRIRSVFPSVQGLVLRKRKEFFEWTREGSRRDLLSQLLPWLQLRGIVLYYFLSCFGDSSKVATAETNELHVQMS